LSALSTFRPGENFLGAWPSAQSFSCMVLSPCAWRRDTRSGQPASGSAVTGPRTKRFCQEDAFIEEVLLAGSEFGCDEGVRIAGKGRSNTSILDAASCIERGSRWRPTRHNRKKSKVNPCAPRADGDTEKPPSSQLGRSPFRERLQFSCIGRSRPSRFLRPLAPVESFRK